MEKHELQSYKQKTGYNLEQLELDYYQHYALSSLYKDFNTIYFDSCKENILQHI